MPRPKVLLSLESVSKRFDREDVLRRFSLQVHDGEFFTLLGPSGCGKTTALRLVAGFDKPDRGTITIDGERVDHLPPEKRPVNTVFQSYALWPNMTVFENIAFGLKVKRDSSQVIEKKVNDIISRA